MSNLNKKLRMIRKLAESFDNKRWSVEYRNVTETPTIDQAISDPWTGAHMIGPPGPPLRGDLATNTAMYLALLDPETVLKILDKLESGEPEIVPVFVVVTTEPDSEILGTYLDQEEAEYQASLHGAYVVESKVNLDG